MTGRETLALAVVAAPALTAVLAAVTPRRVVPAVATVGAITSAVAACALSAVALTRPVHPFVGRYVVVDAAGGLLVEIGRAHV